MVGQRRRRRANNKTSLFQRVVLAGIVLRRHSTALQSQKTGSAYM